MPIARDEPLARASSSSSAAQRRASSISPSSVRACASRERHSPTAGLTWLIASERRPHSRSSSAASAGRPCASRTRPRAISTHTTG